MRCARSTRPSCCSIHWARNTRSVATPRPPTSASTARATRSSARGRSAKPRSRTRSSAPRTCAKRAPDRKGVRAIFRIQIALRHARLCYRKIALTPLFDGDLRAKQRRRRELRAPDERARRLPAVEAARDPARARRQAAAIDLRGALRRQRELERDAVALDEIALRHRVDAALLG